MILKSVSISFAAASIVTVSKTSGEHKNLVFFQHFWFSNQVVDMYNVSVSTHQIKSELRFLFAVESVSRHYYYFWFCFFIFHNFYFVRFSAIAEFVTFSTLLADNISRNKFGKFFDLLAGMKFVYLYHI